jgi:hypothetical protein
MQFYIMVTSVITSYNLMSDYQGPDFDDMSSFFSLCSKRCF